jgi:hypothetical protein
MKYNIFKRIQASCRKYIPNALKKRIHDIKYYIIGKQKKDVFLFTLLIQKHFFKSKIKDYRRIPIIINNRNRYSYLKLLIEYLEMAQYTKIIILDNNSTYLPLLEYYKNIPHRVIHLRKNLGYMALNKCSLYNEVKNDYFVYTDADILPIDECPQDFLKYYLDVLENDIFLQKIGFSLKTDDLPDWYEKKQKVIEWEKQFWIHEEKTGLYAAAIDTTFALHRPRIKCSFLTKYVKHYRTAFPYQARHLPWYENSKYLPDEMKYYYEHAKIGNHW